MKNRIFVLAIITALALIGCKEYPISYLNTKNLKYPSNTLTVVQGLTEEDMYLPEGQNPGGGGGFPGFPGSPSMPGGQPAEKTPSKYKARITNKAPWLSAPFWGASVEGSRPLTIEIESVKCTGEKADAEKLKKNVTVYGEGVFSVPFENDIPLGSYLVSLKISNVSGSQVVKDCFTIIVTDKK